MQYDPMYPPNVQPHGQPALPVAEKPVAVAPYAPTPPLTKLQYVYAYQYVFESPNWAMNLLAGTLAILTASMIPIIGPLIFLGYQFELIEHLHLRRTMPYPDFDFNRFGDYLKRGIAPLIVSLVLGVMLVPIFFLAYFGTFVICVLIAAGVENSGGPPALTGILIFIVIALAFVLLLLVIAVVTLVTLPMSLRAGLSGEIGEGFNFGFVKDFLARTWKDALLANLWLMVAGTIAGLLGLMLCFVGVYPAAALNMLAGTHLHWQLYEIYLSRGGAAIPVKKAW